MCLLLLSRGYSYNKTKNTFVWVFQNKVAPKTFQNIFTFFLHVLFYF